MGQKQGEPRAEQRRAARTGTAHGADQRGTALVSAVASLLILSLVGGVVVSLVGTETYSTLHQTQALQGYWLAETGAHRALAYLSAEGGTCATITGAPQFTNVSVGSGTFTVEATRYTPTPTNLTSSITATDTIIPVTSTTGFASHGRITVGPEAIDYAAKAATTFTGARRGAAGTTAASHSPTSTPVVMEWDLAGAVDWATGAVAIKPAGSPSPGIGLDAVSSMAQDTAASSYTWAHTVAGSNRLLLVGVAIRNSGSETVSSMTYGGAALTFVGAQNNGTNVRTEIWRRVAPATEANNVVVNLSGSVKIAAGAISLTGVDQSNPIDASAFASGGPLSFDKVWDFDNATYNDETADAASTATADVTIFRTDAASAGDFFYVGRASTFRHVVFDLSTVGAGLTLDAEYWNGAAWTTLAFTDTTASLTVSGDVRFTPPTDWAMTSVNGSTQYWVRLRTTTNPTTAPVGTRVVLNNPTVSVNVGTDRAWVIDTLAFRSSGKDRPLGAVGAGQNERWSRYTESGGSSSNIRGKGSIEGPVPPKTVAQDQCLVTSTGTVNGAAGPTKRVVELGTL